MHDPVLLVLLVLVLCSMYLYFPLNKGRARYFLESPLDRFIPFEPAFIFVYFALAPLIALGLLCALTTPFAVPLYLTLIVGVLGGSLIRFFVHSGIRQPEIRRRDLASRLVHWLYLHDDRAHTFPSSHVLISVIMSYFLALAYPGWAVAIWSAGILVALSTMFVRQHYVVDVVGGAGMAIVAIYVTGLILPLFA